MQIEEKLQDFDTTKLVSTHQDELPCQLKAVLKKIAHEEGYLNYNILSRSISTEGGNYMAMLYEVDLKGRTNEGEKETNMFIKRVISQEHVKIINLSDIYSRELFFYNDLSKVFKELETEADVPLDERYKSVKSYNESDTEAIIMQNLNKEGFTTIYRMNVMPLKFAELSVQQLARFHALSFIIEQKRPEYFEKKIKSLKPSIQYGDDYVEFCKNMYKVSSNRLSNEIKDKIDKKADEYMKNYLTGHKTDVKCLCHGDYRMNNILLKLTEGEITDVIPVDYQLMYYGSPIVDFLFFIFGATDKEFRRNHFVHLKDMYHETMEQYLKYFDIDIDIVYPKKKFEMDFEDNLEFGLELNLYIAPIIFTLEDDVPDFDKVDLLEVKVKLDDRYYERLQGVVDDMIEWGKL
ncbi:PREDICTED: uncharacterized protein LOC106121089 [Papilio xuthus]|uniref:Uncharacterized protein LOC106121089 n=2 Tax=Papilio xuthus TaxID=66420 RepID=A0AAJ7ECM7_PAPXU|nr:PREDICTED: uncharacterized protein LOC106121089 [Papilio xuthus]